MQLVYKILLGVTVFLLLVAGGLVAFYFLKYLKLQPRTFFLLWTDKLSPFSVDDGNNLAAHFGGSWAAMSDLKNYQSQGYTNTKAGWVSDTDTPLNPQCVGSSGTTGTTGAPPTSYYVDKSNGPTGPLSNACSAGYYIVNGYSSITPPSGWQIMAFDNKQSIPNSWDSFVDSLVYVGLNIKNIF